MGKNKKKSLKEKDHNETDGEMKSNKEKPLPKLVLKVKEKKFKAEHSDGGSVDGEHSHHKKKKKKHKHKLEEGERKSRKREATDPIETETPSKRIHIKKEKEKKQETKEPKISPLILCLQNFHRNLQRKDVYGIFTYPVTDAIAPGYSKIIKKPMDFLTMSKKIESSEYTSVDEFKQDYVVMCNNAMLYNGSDTIYFKSAEKMLSIGLKMLSKEKMKKVNKSIGVNCSDSEDDVVLVDESADVNIDSVYSANESPLKKTPEKKRRENSKSSASSITAAALAAAREARQKLLKKHPKQYYGYLSKDDKGNNSFNILNPDTSEADKSVPANIGKIAGKLATGIVPSQAVHKEDKKYKVIPVSYLLYGPYGSFGPTHDSSLSNMTKEESSLLLQTYGTETGVAYAKSLLQFTKDSVFAHDYVDRLLDTLTNGQHAKLSKSSKDKLSGQVESRENSVANGTPEEKVTVDVDSLKTLNEIGIDVSFLDMFTNQKETNSIKDKLGENATLLQDLKETQNDRLVKQADVSTISEKEQNIATSLTDNLKELISMVAPADVVSSQAVQKAIGNPKTGLPTNFDGTADGKTVCGNQENIEEHTKNNT
ncbi:bromodomain-containing protein 7-like [Hydractinia symbiolongicarpus]|uniref:bromodomain-containing protein 7-like n=1 Tax=Hydractinia symbiolongicarpus TaxID=13093 RepID=UPI0025516C07|nr:bromodomain-containing protein 7-like [Hydractinia symbiolongicarpus]